MDFNLFDWIRTGVKNAVLLGVNDAVESIGTPDNSDIKEHLAASMGGGIAGQSKGKRGRKKLGRSLNDIQKNAS